MKERCFNSFTNTLVLPLRHARLNYIWIISYWIYYVTFKFSYVDTLTLAPVYWNSSNPLFKSSTSLPSIEVQLRDDIDLVCPYYQDPSDTPAANKEYYIIYQVSEQEYRDCTLYPEQNSHYMLVNCSSGSDKRRYTVIFEPFQSIPNVPEYHPGQTYYFLTTSTGGIEGLSNLQYGACTRLNMKLSISVCCSSTTTTTTTQAPPTSSIPAVISSTSPPGFESRTTSTKQGSVLTDPPTSGQSAVSGTSPNFGPTEPIKTASLGGPVGFPSTKSTPSKPSSDYQRTNCCNNITLSLLTLFYCVIFNVIFVISRHIPDVMPMR